MARPKVHSDKKLSEVFSFRCTKSEYDEISDYCELHRLSIAQLVKKGMGRPIRQKPYPIMKAIKTDLFRIGNNLNQIAKQLNSGNRATRIMAASRISELKELKQQLDILTQKIK